MKILFTIPTEDGVRERFQGIAPHAEFVFVDSSALSESDIESADILIGNVPPTMLHAPAGLRFFQTYTAGANAYTVPLRSWIFIWTPRKSTAGSMRVRSGESSGL